MTTFYCDECGNPFEVKDSGVVQAMVNEHLATGDCFTCLGCQREEEAACETE